MHVDEGGEEAHAFRHHLQHQVVAGPLGNGLAIQRANFAGWIERNAEAFHHHVLEGLHPLVARSLRAAPGFLVGPGQAPHSADDEIAHRTDDPEAGRPAADQFARDVAVFVDRLAGANPHASVVHGATVLVLHQGAADRAQQRGGLIHLIERSVLGVFQRHHPRRGGVRR